MKKIYIYLCSVTVVICAAFWGYTAFRFDAHEMENVPISVDLGLVTTGSQVPFSIPVKNNLPQTICAKKVVLGCGCIKSQFKVLCVPPEETRLANFIYTAPESVFDDKKTGRIYLHNVNGNNNNENILNFTVSAKVRPLLMIHPREISFVVNSKGNTDPIKVEILNYSNEKWSEPAILSDVSYIGRIEYTELEKRDDCTQRWLANIHFKPIPQNVFNSWRIEVKAQSNKNSYSGYALLLGRQRKAFSIAPENPFAAINPDGASLHFSIVANPDINNGDDMFFPEWDKITIIETNTEWISKSVVSVVKSSERFATITVNYSEKANSPE